MSEDGYVSEFNGSTFDCSPEDFDLMKEFLNRVAVRVNKQGSFDTSKVAVALMLNGKPHMITATFELVDASNFRPVETKA